MSFLATVVAVVVLNLLLALLLLFSCSSWVFLVHSWFILVRIVPVILVILVLGFFQTGHVQVTSVIDRKSSGMQFPFNSLQLLQAQTKFTMALVPPRQRGIQ